jgi:hypothetical protein
VGWDLDESCTRAACAEFGNWTEQAPSLTLPLIIHADVFRRSKSEDTAVLLDLCGNLSHSLLQKIFAFGKGCDTLSVTMLRGREANLPELLGRWSGDPLGRERRLYSELDSRWLARRTWHYLGHGNQPMSTTLFVTSDSPGWDLVHVTADMESAPTLVAGVKFQPRKDPDRVARGKAVSDRRRALGLGRDGRLPSPERPITPDRERLLLLAAEAGKWGLVERLLEVFK